MTFRFGAIATWNPFRCAAANMPPSVLLMSKLIALAVLLTRSLPSGLSSQIATWVVVAALLVNRTPRLMALVLSAILLAQSELLPALFLFLAACHGRDSQPLAIQWLLAVVYFVAGTSGSFRHFWLPTELGWPAYSPLWLPLTMLAFAAAIGLFIPHLIQRIGIPAAVAASTLPVILSGAPLNLLTLTLPAALFVFLYWKPAEPLLVIYDGECGFCDWSREWLSRFDYDGAFAWVPYQSGAGESFGISEERARERLQLVLPPTAALLEGFQAIRRMGYYLPVLWLALLPLLAILPGFLTRLVLAVVVLVLSPLVNPFGRAAYDWVARNRHRLFPGRTCALPPAREQKVNGYDITGRPPEETDAE